MIARVTNKGNWKDTVMIRFSAHGAYLLWYLKGGRLLETRRLFRFRETFECSKQNLKNSSFVCRHYAFTWTQTKATIFAMPHCVCEQLRKINLR